MRAEGRISHVPPWLRRAFAHRGLHDERRGIAENTAPAFSAAIAAGYGIECDVRAAADGEPVVFHDRDLARMTDLSGDVRDFTAAELSNVKVTGTSSCILPLAEMLRLVAGRTPILIEIKTEGDPEAPFIGNMAASVAAYRGSVAVMSFDPGALIAFRRLAPDVPRGLVTMRHQPSDWPDLTVRERLTRSVAAAMHTVRPAFIACQHCDLTALIPPFHARGFQGPVLAWTVRSLAERRAALLRADGIIFERIRPPRPFRP